VKLLSVKDLEVRFSTRKSTIYAVNGISFTLDEGETLGIVGESGCGKSVTALAMLGILPKQGRVPEGTVEFGGQDLLRCSGQGHRDDLPRSDDVAQPGLEDRAPADRSDT
jgi:ABC-type glutathione transport system ATPase component